MTSDVKSKATWIFRYSRTDKQVNRDGRPVVGLNAKIDWEVFPPDLNRIHEEERKSYAGAKPIDMIRFVHLLRRDAKMTGWVRP